MERWEAKLIAMSLTFLIMFVCGALPIKVSEATTRKGEKGQFIISILTCFGGGAFFGAYLLHMAPEVRFLLEDSLLDPHGIEYPLPELFIGLGFFMIIYVEYCVLKCTNSEQTGGHTHTHAPCQPKMGEDEMTGRVRLTSISSMSDERKEDKDKPGKSDSTQSVPNGGPHIANGGSVNQAMEADETQAGITSVQVVVSKEMPVTVVGTTDLMPSEDVKGELDLTAGPGGEPESMTTSQARALVLVLALSLECIFEGLALGLKTTTVGVWNLFIAIVSHEAIMAFCLGLELVKYYRTRTAALGAFFYAMTVPVGCAIGMAILETQDEASDAIDITNGVLQGLAAGCFIYVTFFGILNNEMRRDTRQFARLCSVFVGFLVMVGLGAIHETEEEEEDDEEQMTTIATTIMDMIY